jgi:hypothetical protein
VEAQVSSQPFLGSVPSSELHAAAADQAQRPGSQRFGDDPMADAQSEDFQARQCSGIITRSPVLGSDLSRRQ